MPNACFRFECVDGLIVFCADYGKKFLLGKPTQEAFKYGPCILIAVDDLLPNDAPEQ